jgi:hypothetical protein
MWKLGLLALMLVSCKSGEKGEQCANPSDGVLNGSVSTAQLGGGCDDNLTGAAVGSSCKQGTDCAPACCACAAGTSQANVSVSYCKQGKCATVEEACCTFDATDGGPDGNPLCP